MDNKILFTFSKFDNKTTNLPASLLTIGKIYGFFSESIYKIKSFLTSIATKNKEGDIFWLKTV